MGEGWSESIQDTFGEFQLGVWLRESGVSSSDASNAAAGWGGDRLAVLQGPDDSWAVVMRTTWDTDEDAAAFQQAAGPGGRRRPHRRHGHRRWPRHHDRLRLGRRRPRPGGRSRGLQRRLTVTAAGPPGRPAARSDRYIDSGAEIPSNPSVRARVTWVARASASRAPERTGSAVSTTRASR